MDDSPKKYSVEITVNGNSIHTVLIGRHYLKKHSASMNDDLILRLVGELDGGTFPLDSTTGAIDYYAADIQLDDSEKIYRLIWLFEGEKLEVLGVINAYRRETRKKT